MNGDGVIPCGVIPDGRPPFSGPSSLPVTAPWATSTSRQLVSAACAACAGLFSQSTSGGAAPGGVTRSAGAPCDSKVIQQ